MKNQIRLSALLEIQRHDLVANMKNKERIYILRLFKIFMELKHRE